MDILVLFQILALILSVVLHEVAHGYAAYMQGDPTARLQGRLTLNPLKHIDPLGSIIVPGILVLIQANFLFGWAKPVPYNPYNLRNQKWGEALVAIAGPLVNIGLACIFALLIRSGIGEMFLGPMFVTLAMWIVLINLMLAIFNMLPIPPLDGSKILKSILPFRLQMKFNQFEEMMARFGFLFLFLFIFLFMNFFAPIFALIIFESAQFLTGINPFVVL